MRKRVLVCLLAAAMLVTMLAGCGTTSSDKKDGTASAVKDTVTFAMYADLTNMNLLQSASATDQYMFDNLYNGLVTFNDKSEIVGDLADSWTISDDGLTYTFKLHKGVKFHNGEELKASDAVFTIKEGIKSPYTTEYFAAVKDVTAVDDYTVQIILKEPFAPMLFNLVDFFVLNEKAVKEAGDQYGIDNAVGTGPYKFVKHVTGQSVEFERFDDYFKGKAPIKKVVYKIITDTNSGSVALQSGDVDCAFSIPDTALKSIKNDANLTVNEFKSTFVQILWMNNSKKPFNNVYLRQAINYAVDKDSLIQMAAEGNGQKADTILNELTFGYSKDIKGYEYNPEKAKQLLAKAGYANGLTIEMQTIEPFKKIAQVLQEDLRQIGITVNIKVGEKNAVMKDILTGNYEMCAYGITLMGDFDQWSLAFKSNAGVPFPHYANKKVDELFDKGKKEMDKDKRLAIYKELLQTLTDDAVVVPLYHPTKFYVTNKNLKMGYINVGGIFRVAEMKWVK